MPCSVLHICHGWWRGYPASMSQLVQYHHHDVALEPLPLMPACTFVQACRVKTLQVLGGGSPRDPDPTVPLLLKQVFWCPFAIVLRIATVRLLRSSPWTSGSTSGNAPSAVQPLPARLRAPSNLILYGGNMGRHMVSSGGPRYSIVIVIVITNQDSTSSRLLPGSSYSYGSTVFSCPDECVVVKNQAKKIRSWDDHDCTKPIAFVKHLCATTSRFPIPVTSSH
jgi:hypothetical protein